MTDTPAGELRETARLMRERAQEALCDSTSTLPWRVAEGRDCECCDAVRDAIGSLVCNVDDRQSAHVAGMHPGMALAVADWLDAAAERAERPGALALHSLGPGPLATARVYLGTAEGSQA